MSAFLDILNWAVIAGGTLGAALAGFALARGRARRQEAGPGRPDQPRTRTVLCLSLSTVLLASGRLTHGTAAWVAMGLAGCFTCGAIAGEPGWPVNSGSRPARSSATDDPT